MKNQFSAWNEEVYEHYPRKIGKRAAIRAIEGARTRLHDGEFGRPMVWEEAQQLLLVKTRQFATSPAGRRFTYTPHPSTFFNQARYLDDPKEWSDDNGTNNGNKTAAQLRNERFDEMAERACSEALNPEDIPGSVWKRTDRT